MMTMTCSARNNHVTNPASTPYSFAPFHNIRVSYGQHHRAARSCTSKAPHDPRTNEISPFPGAWFGRHHHFSCPANANISSVLTSLGEWTSEYKCAQNHMRQVALDSASISVGCRRRIAIDGSRCKTSHIECPIGGSVTRPDGISKLNSALLTRKGVTPLFNIGWMRPTLVRPA